MSVIILLNGHEEAMRPQTATRPWPLLEVAGGTMVGYLLMFLAEVLAEQQILMLLSEGNRPVADYLRTHFPDYNFNFLHLEGTPTDMQALGHCRPHLRPDEPVYLIDGAAIYRADFPAMANQADGTILVQEQADHGRGHFALQLDADGSLAMLESAQVGALVATGRVLAALG